MEQNLKNPLSREVRISLGWADNFTYFKPTTMPFSRIINVITNSQRAYSFSWYKNNYRAIKNVIPGIDVIALDFDNCPKVEQLIEEKFDKYYGFISPTKSHMKDKGGLIVPRYRVILLLKETLFLDARNYSQAYANMVEDLELSCSTYCNKVCSDRVNYACDVAVKDPTRLFYGALVDSTLIRPLKGGEYLPFEQFDYKKIRHETDLEYITKLKVDINKYKHIDMSKYEDLNPSVRYECPICAMDNNDPNKHHLGLSADGKYITCFYDENHSKILRKLKYMDVTNYADFEEDLEENKRMAKIAATPEIFKFLKQEPKPSNVDILKVQKSFDKSLEYFKEHHDLLGLDIETFTREIPEYTREEAKEKYKAQYTHIVGAYDTACEKHLCDGFDNYNILTRLVSITHQTIDPGNPNPKVLSIPFDLYIMTEDQKKGLIEIIKNAGMVTGHNLKFDFLTLSYNFGIDNVMPKYLFDTMLGARIDQMARDVEPAPAGNGLEACLWRYCGIKVNKEVEHSWGNSNLDLIQLHYSIHDTSYLPLLMNAELRSIKESLGTFDFKNHPREELEFLGPLLNIHPVVALEMQFLRQLIRIEYNGVQPDLHMLTTKADEFYKKYYKKQDELGVNLNSPVQFKKWLQQNIDPNITTTSAKVIEPIFEHIPEFSEAIEARRAYKKAVLMDAMTCVKGDGRLHPQFNQLLNTGRQACKNPNMQQIPQGIKHSVYATRGHDWFYGRDKKYTDLYNRKAELEKQIAELEAKGQVNGMENSTI